MEIRSVKQKTCANPECGVEFTPYNSIQKYCSGKCKYKHGLKPKKIITHIKSSPLRGCKSKINKKSKRQAKFDRKYTEVRREFLLKKENQKCRVVVGAKATQVHHMMGRGVNSYADKWAEDNEIPLLIDTRFFLPVSADGHEEVEDNVKWAKEKGFSLSRLAKAQEYKIK